jgi:hypothetical protein
MPTLRLRPTEALHAQHWADNRWNLSLDLGHLFSSKNKAVRMVHVFRTSFAPTAASSTAGPNDSDQEPKVLT